VVNKLLFRKQVTLHKPGSSIHQHLHNGGSNIVGIITNRRTVIAGPLRLRLIVHVALNNWLLPFSSAGTDEAKTVFL
jgi:hypothetical protein